MQYVSRASFNDIVSKASSVLESILPRLMDVALALLLLRSLAPEDVGLLETSQAIVTPTMLFFLSPEQLLYKKLSAWQHEKPGAHLPRIRSLRHLCWLKGLFGLFLATVFFLFSGGKNITVLCGFTWAFSRSLAPQLVGIDREYLRISGRVENAFLLVFFQKSLFLIGALLAVYLFPGRIIVALATIGILSSALSAITAYVLARRIDPTPIKPPADESMRVALANIFREAFVRFSLWSHVNYVVANSIESGDVFTLGMLGFPKRIIGIYGAAVRVANFALALPAALSTWFAMRLAQAPKSAEMRSSARATIEPTLLLLAVAIIQMLGLIFFAPLIAQVLGTTRWTDLEKIAFARYLVALAIGTGLYSITFSIMSWLKLCCDVKALFFRVFVPWLSFSAALYFYFGHKGDVLGIAWANIACYASYGLLTLVFLRHTALDEYE